MKKHILFISIIVVCSCAKEANPPVVLTSNMKDIDAQTAWCGGSILDDGGSQILHKGICWSTEHNPTVDDSKTDEGEGNESFESKLTGLKTNEYYYVRAYASNKDQTGYGQEVGFKAERNSQFPIVEFNGHFLYVFPRDISQLPIDWGTYGTFIGATDDDDGKKNAIKIIQAIPASEAAAVKYCDELDEYGFDDWYLPSANELKEVYKNKADVGNFKSDGYWCSTEYTPYEAKYVSFLNGKISHTNKTYKYYLRCVRKD